MITRVVAMSDAWDLQHCASSVIHMQRFLVPIHVPACSQERRQSVVATDNERSAMIGP